MDAPPVTRERARRLRARMTLPEQLLWDAVRAGRAGLKIRRQHPLGPYILDFYCDAAKLAVEIDGEAHRDRQAADVRRDAWLKSQGVRTLRIVATEVLRDLRGTVECIQREAGIGD